MPSFPAPLKENIAKVSLQAAIAAATLWDYRLFDLRIFDGAAIILLGLWFIVTPEPKGGFLLRRQRYWLLFLTIFVYAAAGFVLHGHRSSLAIIVLGTTGFILAGRTEWLKTIGPLCWVLVCIHVIFFAVQFTGFYGFGQVIDYQAIIDEASRIMLAPTHMRAAGLFQESNSYCLNLFVLTSTAILWRPYRLATIVAALTMIVSESLWGLGAALVLIFLNELRLQSSLRQLLSAVVVSGVIIGAIFNGYLWLNKSPDEHLPYFYWRITSIMEDQSLRERYLRNTCARAEQIRITSISPQRRFVSLLLGDGLSTGFFKECLPANGISFLLKSFGAAGMISLLAGMAMTLRGLPGSAKLYALLAIVFTFTSYPLMTYLIFWLWLLAIIGLLRFNVYKPNPPDEPAPPKTRHQDLVSSPQIPTR
jgi:hypothetical protein